ncbi:hypothetical protein [Falsiroseomonas sp. E2-1-a4]|uniref:hypothetical protein n=1 Tax=Falsiroseomonas sp. E2-1-a4 TaxID=3239299 RepID=UPI003F33EF27
MRQAIVVPRASGQAPRQPGTIARPTAPVRTEAMAQGQAKNPAAKISAGTSR